MGPNNFIFLFLLCLSLILGTLVFRARRRNPTLRDLRGPESKSFWLGAVSIIRGLVTWSFYQRLHRSSARVRISKGDRRIRVRMDARTRLSLAGSRMHGCKFAIFFGTLLSLNSLLGGSADGRGSQSLQYILHSSGYNFPKAPDASHTIRMLTGDGVGSTKGKSRHEQI